MSVSDRNLTDLVVDADMGEPAIESLSDGSPVRILDLAELIKVIQADASVLWNEIRGRISTIENERDASGGEPLTARDHHDVVHAAMFEMIESIGGRRVEAAGGEFYRPHGTIYPSVDLLVAAASSGVIDGWEDNRGPVCDYREIDFLRLRIPDEAWRGGILAGARGAPSASDYPMSDSVERSRFDLRPVAVPTMEAANIRATAAAMLLRLEWHTGSPGRPVVPIRCAPPTSGPMRKPIGWGGFDCHGPEVVKVDVENCGELIELSEMSRNVLHVWLAASFESLYGGGAMSTTAAARWFHPIARDCTGWVSDEITGLERTGLSDFITGIGASTIEAVIAHIREMADLVGEIAEAAGAWRLVAQAGSIHALAYFWDCNDLGGDGRGVSASFALAQADVLSQTCTNDGRNDHIHGQLRAAASSYPPTEQFRQAEAARGSKRSDVWEVIETMGMDLGALGVAGGEVLDPLTRIIEAMMHLDSYPRPSVMIDGEAVEGIAEMINRMKYHRYSPAMVTRAAELVALLGADPVGPPLRLDGLDGSFGEVIAHADLSTLVMMAEEIARRAGEIRAERSPLLDFVLGPKKPAASDYEPCSVDDATHIRVL
jgi:hypothetical protein